MKIDVYCLCKNEIKLAPFYIDYWRALAEDVNVYVYDGLSNDGTRELLSKYDWIHIIDSKENETLDDNLHTKFKNNVWKKSKGVVDFVMVCDFDETIFSYDIETLHSELCYMKENKYTVLAPLSFNLIPDTFPDYTDGKYLHELCEYGFNDYVWYSKPILFDPSEIKEMNYCLGAHSANPIGNVKYYVSDKLFLIHAKFIGLDYYTKHIRERSVSYWNLRHNIDAETKKTFERLQQEFNERRDKRFKWCDVKENFDNYYKTKIDWSRWGGLKVE